MPSAGTGPQPKMRSGDNGISSTDPVQDTNAGTSQTSYAGAMFAVTALRQGGRWKIEHIDTFSG